MGELRFTERLAEQIKGLLQPSPITLRESKRQRDACLLKGFQRLGIVSKLRGDLPQQVAQSVEFGLIFLSHALGCWPDISITGQQSQAIAVTPSV